MATPQNHFPYTYYSCPCVNTSAPLPIFTNTRKHSREQPPPAQEESSGNEQTFDPKSPRANLSLLPLEHLLWCPECHEMRCTRCVQEEVVCWYCPTCLFEVPSSTVRSEGNRCTRSCYNCPICTSPLTVNSLDNPTEGSKTETPAGPYILMCGWCNWSSLDLDIKFEKANNITAQINKLRGVKRRPTRDTSGQDSSITSPTEEAPSALSLTQSPESNAEEPRIDSEEMFFRLSNFYRQQISESSDSPPFGNFASSEMSFASPSAISRLLNIYSGKKSKRKGPSVMREALTSQEGLQIVNETQEQNEINRQQEVGWGGTSSTIQRDFQPGTGSRFVADLWPVACLLRTKRSKRCKACRNLLAKPESKMSSSRWKIRILALSHIPKVTLRPLHGPTSIGPYLGIPAPPGQNSDIYLLSPGKTYQYLLTVANPLFDPINVTLATAATTPGRVPNRVTILCPEFTVCANSDVWDEALGGTSKRRSIMSGTTPMIEEEGQGQKTAEAGKIWGKGRNWTSVIVEIQPSLLPSREELVEDEDILEIAVFVRIEYETEVGGEEKQTTAAGVQKEKREEAFWCVLGAGRIKQLPI